MPSLPDLSAGYLSGYSLSIEASGDEDTYSERTSQWLGLFLFLLFLVNTVLSRDFLAFRIADEALLAIDAYFLYRAVKSLAPMSRTPLASNLEPAA